jgi:hypothetical protein
MWGVSGNCVQKLLYTCAMICPKCQYEKQDHETDMMPGVCPSCGIAYKKFLESQQGRASAAATLSADRDQAPEVPFRQRFLNYAGFMPSDRPEGVYWVHVVVYLCFVAWGIYFMAGGVDLLRLGGSFLHGVDQAFHAYGHIMFRPFGETMELLGGSIFQVWAPLFPLVFFMVWHRDNFAASIMLWWCGQNFMDIAVYVADAPVGALPLMAGEAARHDWAAWYGADANLQAADGTALLLFIVGSAIMLLANAWGGWLLWIEFQGRTRSPVQIITEDESTL